MAKVFFLCSPNLAILDSWISVLSRLSTSAPAHEFIFVSPQPRTIREVEPDSVLVKIAGEVFDKVIFRSNDGAWIESSSFVEAKNLAERDSRIIFGRFLRKVIARLANSRPGAWLAEYRVKSPKRLPNLRLRETSSHKCPFSDCLGEPAVLLFDVTEADKPYLQDVLGCFRETPKFSISHGLTVNLNKWDGKNVSSPNYLPETIKVFALSHLEAKFFREKYSLVESAVEVVGVPRHEPYWINHILQLHEGDAEFLVRDYIFFASKPRNDTYLPRNRKIRALQQLKEIAEKHDLHVVVKRHPKEHADGTFEEVFGQRNLGKSWSLRSDHAYFLGKNATFAVVFGGSVPMDMIAIGTPVIGLLDLRNLEQFDHADALRDENGEPVFSPRFLGLLLPGSSRDALSAQITAVLSDSETKIRQLRAAYNQVYPTPAGANQKITTQVLSALTR